MKSDGSETMGATPPTQDAESQDVFHPKPEVCDTCNAYLTCRRWGRTWRIIQDGRKWLVTHPFIRQKKNIWKRSHNPAERWLTITMLTKHLRFLLGWSFKNSVMEKWWISFPAVTVGNVSKWVQLETSISHFYWICFVRDLFGFYHGKSINMNH